MEKCLFGRAEVYLPNLLTEDLGTFLEVVGVSTWQRELNDGHRHNLMALLPSFGQNDGQEKIRTLQKLFNGENFKFGNPLHNFHKKLQEGHFSPEVAKYAAMIKKAKYKEYQSQQKLYFSKLLKEVLVNRQRLLEAFTWMPPGENVKVEWWRSEDTTSSKPKKSLELTVCKKYRSVIKEINEECDRIDTSSDEEDLLTECSRDPAYAQALLHADDFTPSVFGTNDARPKLANGGSLVRPGKRSVSPVTMNEEAYFGMLKKHKKRRKHAQNAVHMDTSGTSLEDVMNRTYGIAVSKPAKQGKVISKKKPRKTKVDTGSMPALWPADDNAMDSTDLKEEPEDDTDLMHMYVNKQTYGQNASFFSLLRDLVCEEQDTRITTFKIEQKVCDWQKSECAAKNTWFTSQKNWPDVTMSALKFMSGHTLGLELENFVPLLDYRERAQLWKWIGWGHDLDSQMTLLFDTWLENIGNDSDESVRDGMSTPPPRLYTDYVVRPGDEEDVDVFQEQETMRFENPQQAFTYYMHGYESVVGPVKGVYDKPQDDNTLKARDHALLVKDRPPYVNILTLVRDAVARLPNGSGTRSDIVELLKYSQYLQPEAVDSVIHSVVSGALDRLHYEKDPCVKYSAGRKIWIYLHRHRAEDDFNKIHLAAAKVVKAKQALTKPKSVKTAVLKKPKDAVVFTQAGTPIFNQTHDSYNFFHPQHQQQPSPTMFANTSSMSPRGMPRDPHVVEVSTVASMSGLDILSSVAHAKISGDTHSSGMNAPPQVMTTKVVNTAAGRRKVSIARQQQSPDMPATSLLASHLISSTQPPFMATQNKPQPVQTGSKPVAFSLLQSSTVSKLLESQGANIQRQAQSKTVVLSSKQGMSGNPVVATVKQGGGKEMKPIIVERTSASEMYSFGNSGNTGARIVSPNTPGAKPVLARLISQSGGQQVITLPGGHQAVVSSGFKTVSSGVSTPGTPLVQTVAHSGGKPGKPLILQRVSSSQLSRDSRALPSSPLTPSTSQIAVLQKGAMRSDGVIKSVTQQSSGQHIQGIASIATPMQRVRSGITTQVMTSAATQIHRVQTAGKPATVGGKPLIIGGKPMSLLGGKPVAFSGGKPVTIAGRKPVQIGGNPIQIGGNPVQIGGNPLQIGGNPVQIGKPAYRGSTGMQLGGKPVQIGGKPIHVGGKPVQIGGNPVQIGGNPVRIGGKPVQIGGKPIHIGGKPVQMGGKPLHMGGKPVQIGMIQQQASSSSAQRQGTVVVSPRQQSPVQSVAMPTNQAVTLPQSFVNQLIQSGQLKTQPGTTLKGVSGSTLQHVLSGATLAGQQVKVQGRVQPQTSIISPSGMSKAATSEGKRVVAVSQAGLVGAQRIILQSQAQQFHNMSTGKPVVHNSVGVKSGQNIQLVRTVVSQADSKPGTTILLAQSGKPGSSAVVNARHLSQQSVQTLVSQNAPAKGRGAPVFARILTPGSPSGVRLVRAQAPQGQIRMVQGQTISQGQFRAVQGQGQIRNIQGMNVVQTIRTRAPNTNPHQQ